MFAEIRSRLSKPTPAFWRTLQKRTAATSAAFATLTVTVASISNHLPGFLATALAGAATFFGGIAAVCPLAVDDTVPLTIITVPVQAIDLPPASA